MDSIKHILGKLQAQPGASASHCDTQDRKSSEQEQKTSLARDLNVNLSHTFEQFNRRQGTHKAAAACRAFAAGTGKDMLLLYGEPGNGKTHLVEAVCIALNQRGVFCRVTSWSKVIANLKQAMDTRHELDFGLLLERQQEAAWLLLDDVGMGTTDTPWAMGILEEIVCYRYHECDHDNPMPTLIATNRDITQLPARVVDRFRDAQISALVLNEAKSYRGEK